MFWKNWPSWLKGGLIGLIIYIIYFLVVIFTIYTRGEQWKLGMAMGWLGSMFVTGFIITILQFFLIGALIGWVYGKIKSKKQQPVQTQSQVQTK